MELFGAPIETIYLYTLFIVGAITLLYILFGDVAEGITEGLSWLHPTLVMAFITFLSAAGYIFEIMTSLNSYVILIVAALISLLLDICLNVFVLIPLSKAEGSLAYTEESLNGRVGKVITPIPLDGFGEVVLEGNGGIISKSAQSYDQTEIPEGAKVLVIEVEKGVLLVKEYETLF